MTKTKNKVSKDFKQISKNITTVIWKARINKKYQFEQTYISSVIDQILALEKGTIKNDWDKFCQYIKPKYLLKIQTSFKKAILAPGTPRNIEYKVIRADQKKLWFHSEFKCKKQNGKLFTYISEFLICCVLAL